MNRIKLQEPIALLLRENQSPTGTIEIKRGNKNMLDKYYGII